MCLMTCVPVAGNDIFESIAGHPVAVVLELYSVCVNSPDQCGTQNDRFRHTWIQRMIFKRLTPVDLKQSAPWLP